VATVFDVRRANLRLLKAEWGGPKALAQKTGYSTASFYTQMAGPHPTKEVSEKVARKIEAALGLPAGWMDPPREEVVAPPVDHDQVAQVVRAVAAVFEGAGASPKPVVFGEVVAMAYEHAQIVGSVDEVYIRKLIKLCST
jgi:hypothetical protein